MKLELPDRTINAFTVLYRDESIQDYRFKDIINFIKLSEAFDYTGLLLFQSNRGNIEPWVFGQTVLSESKKLSPFVALNPVYEHPFSAAKRILTLGSFYDRKCYI